MNKHLLRWVQLGYRWSFIGAGISLLAGGWPALPTGALLGFAWGGGIATYHAFRRR